MVDVLSQKEIDDLLNASTTGEINVHEIENKAQDKKIREYDFRRPHKFAKDQLRTLQIIYENFSRMMVSYLSGVLRIFCEATVAVVEPQTYHEFSNSFPEPVLLGVIDFNPLKKNSMLIEFSPSIVYAMVDRLLGGPGATLSKSRDFTEIELVLVERIIKQLLSLMNDSWSNVLIADFKLARIETNAQFVQIVSPNETMAIITLNVHIDQVEGMVNICIPHLVLEPIIEKLSTKYWYSSRMMDELNSKHAEVLSSQIELTKLELKAVLGETTINISDFLWLQKGDVIRLDNKINQDIALYIGDIKKFHGIVGRKSKNLAVQITGIERGIDRE